MKRVIVAKGKKFKNNKELLSFYNANGWVSIKNSIKKPEIKEMQNDLNNFFKKHTGRNYNDAMIFLNKSNKKKLFNLYKISSKIYSIKKTIGRLSETVKILNNNLKYPVLQFESTYIGFLPKDKRLTYDYHQESSYQKNFQDLVSIHFPIFYKATVKNGTMSALNKSHKLGHLSYNKRRLSRDAFSNLIPKNINQIEKNFDEIHYELNVGDVLFFHKDLIHKSNFNNSNYCRPVGIGRCTQSFGNFSSLGFKDF